MTDAPLPPDAADELASAHLDGEVTAEERARVQTDPDLQARVEALARARAAVAAPVPVDPVRREAALAAALGAAAEPGGVLAGPSTEDDRTVVPMAARRWSTPSPRWRYLAVAAAVAVAALAVPLLSQLGDDDQDDAASVALEDEAGLEAMDEAERGEDSTMAAPSAAAGGDGGAAGGATAYQGDDLGAFDDVDALVATLREQPELDAAPPTTTGDTGAEGVTSTTLPGPCAGQLDLPAEVEVVLDATATVAGEGVVVVVHRTPGGALQLLVAAVEDCRTLLDQPL